MNIRKNKNQPATPASPYQPAKSKDKGKAPTGGVTKSARLNKSNRGNIKADIKKCTPSKEVLTRSPRYGQDKLDRIKYYTQPTTDEDTRKDLAVYLGIRYMPYIESFSKRLAQSEKNVENIRRQNEQIIRETAPDQNDEAHQALAIELFRDEDQDISLSEDDQQLEQSGDEVMPEDNRHIYEDSDEVMYDDDQDVIRDAIIHDEIDDVPYAPENIEQQVAHQEGAADAATQIKQLTENLNTLIRERDQARTELEKARTTIEKEESRYNYQLGMQDGKEESINEINILKNKLKTAANSVEAEAKRVADSIAGIRQELNQSKADLNTANAQIHSLKEDLENSKTRVKDLTTELSQAKKPEERRAIESELKEAQAELDNTKLAADSLKSELSEALVNLKKNQTEKTNLEVRLNKTKSKLEDLRAEYTRAETRLEKARNLARGFQAETIGAKDELAEAQASWKEAKTNYEKAQESYTREVKDLENQLRKTKFELVTKIPMALKAGGKRGLEIGEKRGIKRGRAEAKEEMERATKVRKAIVTTFSAGIGAVLLGNPLAQTAIENFTQNAFAFASRRGFEFATETIINTADVLPPAAAILGTAGLAGLAYGLSSWSVSDLTDKTK